MSLRDKAEVSTGYMERPMHKRSPAKVELKVRDTLIQRPGPADIYSNQTEREVRVSFYKRFWANEAQLPTAVNYAMDEMTYFIYADYFKYANELKTAIHTGDTEAAFEILNLIEEGFKA